MSLLNLFKKKNNIQTIPFHQVDIKIKKGKNLYIGQFLNIETDYKDDGDFINNGKYYFSSFDSGIVTNKISSSHEKYYEKYRYGIVRSIEGDTATILIICCNGYLQRYDISMKNEYNNGSAFIINNGNLIENNKVVGSITDRRYNNDVPILLNGVDNGKLVVFIQK